MKVAIEFRESNLISRGGKETTTTTHGVTDTHSTHFILFFILFLKLWLIKEASIAGPQTVELERLKV